MAERRPSLKEVIGFIAREEPLEKTRDAFGLSREALRALLLGEAPPRPAAPPPPEALHVPGRFARLVVHSDGAARGNPGPAGAGAVLSTPDGEIVERLGRYLGVQTNNVAEYSALLLGLERARELGAQAVDVVADSELMIRQLEGKYRVKNEGLKPLFDDAKRLLAGFARSTLRHVPRAENKEADEMSNRAIDERMD